MLDKRLRIVIVGTGRLATSLAKAGSLPPTDAKIAIFGRNATAVDEIIASAPSVMRAGSAFISQADLVVLAVAPQAYKSVLESLSPRLLPCTIIVSVTNAVAVEEIGTWTQNPVVKVIPTIAQTVRRGAIPVVAGPRAEAAHIDIVMAWLSRFSLPIKIEEHDCRVASNVAGSAVAAVASFARAFVAANARRAHGLDQRSLEAMMSETLAAVGDLARAGVSFDQAIEATATPGGVTEAALVPLAEAIDEICEKMVAASFREQSQLQATVTSLKDGA